MGTSGTGYIPSLDGLRAFAVGLVALAHCNLEHVVPGGLGVTVFFFLSGYLISTLLYREQRRHNRVDIKAFYLRRILRLSPPLWLALIVGYGLYAAGLVEGGFYPANLASQLMYFSNYYNLYGPQPQWMVDGQFLLWSLAVEEHFYLMYPLFFAFLCRRPSTATRLAWMVGVLATALAWRVFARQALGFDSRALTFATDARLDGILFGCLLALMVEEGLVQRLLPATRRAAVVAQGLGLTLLLVTLVYRDPLFRDTLRFTLQGLAMIPLFYYAVHMPELPWHRPLNWTSARVLGLYSYSIYLIHHVAISALETSLGITDPPLLWVGGGALAVGYAALAYRWVEQPMAELRRRLHRVPALA